MFLKHGLGAFAGFVVTLATPALANETAATTQIAGSVKAESSISGDTEFRELFASWGGEESRATGIIPVAPRASVAIPSQSPMQGYRLSSSYGMRTHPVLGGRRGHTGIDLAAPTGTPVYATADGLVSRASRFSSYGNFISIEHGGDLQTRYAHLSGYAVAEGDRVTKGQLIGFVGSTGRSTGPHLHYEVRVSGDAVDPRPYMTGATELAAVEVEGGRGGGPEE